VEIEEMMKNNLLEPIVADAEDHRMTWEDAKKALEWQISKLDAAEAGEDAGRSVDFWIGYGEALQMMAFSMFPREFHNWVMDRMTDLINTAEDLPEA